MAIVGRKSLVLAVTPLTQHRFTRKLPVFRGLSNREIEKLFGTLEDTAFAEVYLRAQARGLVEQAHLLGAIQIAQELIGLREERCVS